MSGGTSSTATPRQDCLETTQISTTTARPVSKAIKDKVKDQQRKDQLKVSLTTLLGRVFRTLHIQQLVDRKPLRQHSVEVQLDQAHQVTQPGRLAISRQVLVLLVLVVILPKRLQEPLVTSHPVHRNILALKVLTQAPELPFPHLTCHRHPINLLKVSHPNPTPHTQLQERLKRQHEITCHQDEVKLM